MKPDKYALADAARNFVRMLRQADESTRDAAFQYLASDANNSDYAEALEPLQNICGAFVAEGKRRAFEGGHDLAEREHVFAEERGA